MTRCAAVCILALCLSGAATAQSVQRSFPANALRGEMTVGQPPEITLNGQSARLAPGARIRGQNNLLQMSGALIGRTLPVHYVLGPSDLVHDVWILTDAELAKKPWPRTMREAQTWVFDPVAQVWTPR
jgi:hypothetical protein